MSAERWHQVDRIFHDALEQDIHERGPYLDRVCAGDAALRKEIEDLLRSFEDAGSFMDAPASDNAHGLPGVRGSLAGRIFGRYELRSLLGSGGMGDVYRARDSELKRDIAIKVLPDAFSRDAARVARFRREAEILASLNHSNIAAIYDFETLGESRCLVLELVEGETLADRLARGPIPIDEALRLAKQVADALEAAHEKGIIHRDLKPSNIKITQDGTVKVLDFGLAKVREAEAAAAGMGSNLPAAMTTTPGMIMGTVAYMSPEQARGKAVDKRGDIWAFGCVLYEMLTGRSLFGRDTASDTLAAILERNPSWSELPATTPAAVHRLLFRCLDKNLRGRLHDIADARIEIEDVVRGTPTPRDSGDSERPVPAGLRWSIAAPVSLVALLAVVILTWSVITTPRVEPAAAGITRFTIPLSGTPDRGNVPVPRLGITPDGARCLYVDYIDGHNTLVVRSLDQFDGAPLATSNPPLNFIFANDQSAGFVEGTLLRWVPLNGGSPLTILDTGTSVLGATWAPENMIIFADKNTDTGLKRVSAAGGPVSVLTRPDPLQGELDHVWPEMLPGGKAVLLTVTAVTGGIEKARVAVLDLTAKIPKLRYLVGGTYPHYVRGRLVYAAEGELRAIGFDLDRLEIFGTTRSVLPRVQIGREGRAGFAVSANGTLTYVDGPNSVEPDGTLVWVDRQGHETALGAAPLAYSHPRVSPDETKVAVAIRSQNGGTDIRIWDLLSRRFTQLTSPPEHKAAPIWVNGSDLAFFSVDSDPTLWRQPADASRPSVPLGSGGPPSGITPEGQLLISYEGKDLKLVALDNSHRVQDLLVTGATESNGIVSPNGRLLAYQSDKSGAGPQEIYVARYPIANTPPRKISSESGTQPLWSPKGQESGAQELFYVRTSDGAIMSVHIDGDGQPLGAATAVVVGGPYFTTVAGIARTYDVSKNGQNFLLVKKIPGEKRLAPPQIRVVPGWLEELNRLVPLKR